MAVYTVPTTAEMSLSTFSLVGLNIGDRIVTEGYYAAGDGGAAEFEVKAGSADTYFSHSIYGYAGWVADLVIRDGIVYADQLGAKGDAQLSNSYDTPISDLTEYNTRSQAVITANTQASDNQPVLYAAFHSDRAQEIRLTTGKIYAVRSGVSMQSNHVLNGCGAAIMNLFQNANSGTTNNILSHNRSAGYCLEDVEICNLRLIGNNVINGANIQGIFVKFGRNIHIHDVEIERCNFGIHFTIEDADAQQGHANQANIDHVHIHDVRMGIQYNAVRNSSIEDSTISADFTRYMGAHNGDHCIYGTDGVQNCVFRNLALLHQHRGNGIILKAGKGVSKDLLVENVRMDDCLKGIGWENVDAISIHKMICTNISEVGINLGNSSNAIVKNCRLSGTGGGFRMPQGATSIHCLICDSIFVFPSCICQVDTSHNGHSDVITVKNCLFKIFSPSLAYSSNPVFARGLVARMYWNRCVFDTEGFTSASVPEADRINNSRNGVLFYFVSDRFTDVRRHWFFDRCHFINRGLLSVNSPILSLSNSDSNGIIYCSIRNCLFDNYRWTIRIATTIDTETIVSDTVVNPCFDGINDSYRPLAAAALDNRERFHAHNNLYHWNDQSPEYITAEEYGS